MLWFDDSVDRSTIPLPKFNSANSSDLGLSTVTEKKKSNINGILRLFFKFVVCYIATFANRCKWLILLLKVLVDLDSVKVSNSGFLIISEIRCRLV